jgi:hypothetical protein
MGTAQAVQALGHPWLALLLLLLSPIIHLAWLRIRTRVNIARAKDRDRAARDIDMPEDQRLELFSNGMQRDLHRR